MIAAAAEGGRQNFLAIDLISWGCIIAFSFYLRGVVFVTPRVLRKAGETTKST